MSRHLGVISILLILVFAHKVLAADFKLVTDPSDGLYETYGSCAASCSHYRGGNCVKADEMGRYACYFPFGTKEDSPPQAPVAPTKGRSYAECVGNCYERGSDYRCVPLENDKSLFECKGPGPGVDNEKSTCEASCSSKTCMRGSEAGATPWVCVATPEAGRPDPNTSGSSGNAPVPRLKPIPDGTNSSAQKGNCIDNYANRGSFIACVLDECGGFPGNASCYNKYKPQGLQSSFDSGAAVINIADIDTQLEKCESQATTTVSCCKQIDQCLISDNPDQVDKALGAVISGASTIYAGTRDADLASEQGLKALCAKPTDFFNIVNTSYGALRARSCDNYKSQCDSACSANAKLQSMAKRFSTECSPSNSNYYQNMFSYNFRLGCDQADRYSEYVEKFKAAQSKCGQATLEAAKSDNAAAGSLAAYFINNSKQQQQFREKCRAIMDSQQLATAPNLFTDCNDPKYRSGAQCQACLANPNATGCDKVIGIPKAQNGLDSQNPSGQFVGGPGSSPTAKRDFSAAPGELPPEDIAVDPGKNPEGKVAAGVAGANPNVPDAKTGPAPQSPGGPQGQQIGRYYLGDPQGYGAIGGTGGYRGTASTDGASGGASALKGGDPINWSKYLPGGALYGRGPNGLAAGGLRSEIYGQSTDIFKSILDRYYSLCKRGNFIEACTD